MNYWDQLMGDDESAAMYMDSYGEGVGSDTRDTIGGFINDGESLLDVGCGPGWNYEHFQKHGPELSAYKGVDYSERFVRVCQGKYPEADFEVQDARDLKEPDGSWDVVLFQDVLDHTNGYEKPMEHGLRIASKRIIVVFWRNMRETGDHQINDDGNDGYGATYDRGLWEEYLDSLGYHWMDTQSNGNRPHTYYIIDKEEKHG